ncbi:MAG: hypothetical protein IKX14_00980, partial [Neisseriaceae bacterium]|nr:hypothetical protein [Neisseriaceae bacterium]
TDRHLLAIYRLQVCRCEPDESQAWQSFAHAVLNFSGSLNGKIEALSKKNSSCRKAGLNHCSLLIAHCSLIYAFGVSLYFGVN